MLAWLEYDDNIYEIGTRVKIGGKEVYSIVTGIVIRDGDTKAEVRYELDECGRLYEYAELEAVWDY